MSDNSWDDNSFTVSRLIAPDGRIIGRVTRYCVSQPIDGVVWNASLTHQSPYLDLGNYVSRGDAKKAVEEALAKPAVRRANYLGVSQYFNLNHACRVLAEAFGWCLYLVGSVLERRDYRDVDIRCILPDEEFERLFPGLSSPSVNAHTSYSGPNMKALWVLMGVAISEWLSNRTGLPIDFQIQKQSEANAAFPHQPRSALIVIEEPASRAPESV